MTETSVTKTKSRDELRFGTNIINETEYRDRLITIMDIASEMVKKTLGPYGATTIVDDGLFTYPTKDGWTVLKNLRFNDGVANAIYTSAKQVSFNTATEVGDGTTTSFVGANIFMKKLNDLIKTSKVPIRQKDFLDALSSASEAIQAKIENSGNYVHRIDPEGDFSDIRKIAYTSSNGNEKLADIIQKIYQETINPNIYVKYDTRRDLGYEIQRGYKLDCKAIQQQQYRNSDDGTYTLKEPSMVAIFDHTLTYIEHGKMISLLSQYSTQHNTSIFILAPHFDSTITNVIGTSINRMLQNNQIPNIMLIQIPLSRQLDRDYVTDLGCLTNAQIFDAAKVHAINAMVFNQTATEEDKMSDPLLESGEYDGMTPGDFLESMIGKVQEISVGASYLVINKFDSVVNPSVYENAVKTIRDHYEELKTKMEKSSTALQKDYMDAYQRYTKFTGNMGVILVGGGSDLEKHCTKDSVDDAVLACRSAYDHGYVRGMNLATISAIREIFKNPFVGMNDDTLQDAVSKGDFYTASLIMLHDTFVELSRAVLENKYDSQAKYECNIQMGTGSMTYKFTNDEVIEHAIKADLGFDMETNQFYIDKDCPVINSTKTDIVVIRGIVSIISMLLTSNQLLSINQIFDRDKSKEQKDADEIARLTSIAKEVTKSVLDTIESQTEEYGTSGRSFGIFNRLLRFFEKKR